VLPVELQLTGFGPVMLQVGLGLTTRVVVQLVVHPALSVTWAV
jgi:hypothetical protein